MERPEDVKVEFECFENLWWLFLLKRLVSSCQFSLNIVYSYLTMSFQSQRLNVRIRCLPLVDILKSLISMDGTNLERLLFTDATLAIYCGEIHQGIRELTSSWKNHITQISALAAWMAPGRVLPPAAIPSHVAIPLWWRMPWWSCWMIPPSGSPSLSISAKLGIMTPWKVTLC